MKNTIYKDVTEVINKYPNVQKSIIFSLIKEELSEFNVDVIESNLNTKLNEILRRKLLTLPMSPKSTLFQVPANVDLIKMFSEYLEFRYKFNTVFERNQSTEYLMRADELRKYAIEDFSILQNRFLDSQFFYTYGRFDIHDNSYSHENGIPENHVRIDGDSRTMAYALLINGLSKAFRHKVSLEDDSLYCLFYGKLTFDTLLKVNVINVSQFYS